jgi:transcriptional regulator with PAS, ATPase and Fis domain
VGKESFPKIIHHLSSRKHGPYIAVNCGAIPEGTIDSELFGHEKGSFTGAHESRKGYFEVANGGTIFLDEVAELPLSTQVRLLRVLESGEFIKVGSSKVLKTDVRIVAATNVDMQEAINEGKFRQDLFYRLSTVPIEIPPLRERQDDIELLFRKFAADFAEKYRMPVLRLTEEARMMLREFRWPGNVRQLKNITEQISIIEQEREITPDVLRRYLPEQNLNKLPVLYKKEHQEPVLSDRDLLYKVLFDMRKDINDLKKVVVNLISESNHIDESNQSNSRIIRQYYEDINEFDEAREQRSSDLDMIDSKMKPDNPIQESEIVEESLSLQKKEIDLIKRALEKYKGKRKMAAKELGISERTLYRKIKEYKINL